MLGDLVRFPDSGVAVDDANKVVARIGLPYEDIAAHLNDRLGSTFICAEMVHGWARGLSRPPRSWCYLLDELSQRVPAALHRAS